MLTLSETSFNSLVCSCGILPVWRSRSQGSGFTQSIAGFGDRNSVLIPYVPTTADPQYVCSFARSVSKQSSLKHGILLLVLFGGGGGGGFPLRAVPFSHWFYLRPCVEHLFSGFFNAKFGSFRSAAENPPQKARVTLIDITVLPLIKTTLFAAEFWRAISSIGSTASTMFQCWVLQYRQWYWFGLTCRGRAVAAEGCVRCPGLEARNTLSMHAS